jgi:hypothetical protein
VRFAIGSILATTQLAFRAFQCVDNAHPSIPISLNHFEEIFLCFLSGILNLWMLRIDGKVAGFYHTKEEAEAAKDERRRSAE